MSALWKDARAQLRKHWKGDGSQLSEDIDGACLSLDEAVAKCDALRTQLAAPSAREARLREALEEFADAKRWGGGWSGWIYHGKYPWKTAQAALADPPRPVERNEDGHTDACHFRFMEKPGACTCGAPAPRYTREERKWTVGEIEHAFLRRMTGTTWAHLYSALMELPETITPNETTPQADDGKEGGK